mmetsp:Transcript_46170/g.103557  ORF Transcript_46170/g.103557 Transcript_46170/m.103557 type:complete len:337 (+) Transcript_46170:656-1666(+)
MNGKVREALLHHGRDLSPASLPPQLRRSVSVLFVARERQQMHQRGCRGVVCEGQPKEATHRIDQDATHKKIKMVACRLLQLAGWAIHDDGGEVLVQVAQERQAKGGHHGGEDCPHGEILVDAKGVHYPRPCAACLWVHPAWPELVRNLEPLNVGLSSPNVGDQSNDEDGDRGAEVRQRSADGSGEPDGLLHVFEPHCDAKRGEAENGGEEGRLSVIVDVCINQALDCAHEVDLADEPSKNVLHEPCEVRHQGRGVSDRQQHSEECAPQTLPHTSWEELDIELFAESVENYRVCKLRPRCPLDAEWLPRKHRVDNSNHSCGHQRFNDTKLVVSRLTH